MGLALELGTMEGRVSPILSWKWAKKISSGGEKYQNASMGRVEALTTQTWALQSLKCTRREAHV